jgi:hypothetical protein
MVLLPVLTLPLVPLLHIMHGTARFERHVGVMGGRAVARRPTKDDERLRIEQIPQEGA